MIPEERFGRWAAIGVPLFLLVGIIGSVVIHVGYAVSWAHLFVPTALFVGLQIGSYLEAFWVGKWGRQKKRFWPMALLSGFYLWGAGMIIMTYGARWGILPSFGDSRGFSVCMALITVIAGLLLAKFGQKLTSAISQQNK